MENTKLLTVLITVTPVVTSGTNIKYTQANGATPNQQTISGLDSAVAVHITGTGDAAVFAIDASDNKSPLVSRLVPPPPK